MNLNVIQEERDGPSGDALDRVPFGVISFTDDGTVVAANRGALDLLGLERAALLGRAFESILTVGARIFYQTHFFPMLSLHGHADEIYLQLRTRDGDAVGVLANVVRHEQAGGATSDCAFMRVGEREKFEQELIEARRAAERARAEVQAQAEAMEYANQQLEAQAVELELQQQTLEEQTVELELQADALQSANSALLEHGEELERQRRAAEEANLAKSRFLAVMSHELRTPLNAIGGYTQLLEMGIHGPVTEAQREVLARVDRSQRHLLSLINDVLNLSRIEAGRVEYALEALDLATLVESVAPMVEPQLAARRIDFRVALGPGIVAWADREKVQQILLNLLGNAVKFTPEDGRVVLDTHLRAEEPGCVFVRVSDSGPGIPPEMQASIFEPFVQVDTSHTRSVEGTGLGLAISRDLARGMGGDLRVRSTVGQGARFTLALPAARPADPA